MLLEKWRKTGGHGGRDAVQSSSKDTQTLINKVFGIKTELGFNESKHLFTEVIELPTYFCALLFERLGKTTKDTLKKQEFLTYWKT